MQTPIGITIIKSFISLMKKNISYNCENILQNRKTIAPSPWTSLYSPCPAILGSLNA